MSSSLEHHPLPAVDVPEDSAERSAGLFYAGDNLTHGPRFTVKREIGYDGPFVLYLAQTDTGTDVTIKVPREPSLSSIALLHEERKLLRAIGEHENVIALDESMEPHDDFIALKYVTDLSLSGKLTSSASSNFDSHYVSLLLTQLLKALAHIHGQGVIHRNIRPSSVLLRDVYGCDARLTNFAHATFLGSTTNVSGGKGLYQSPESRAADRAISSNADVWSLGVLIYEMINGNTVGVNATDVEAMLSAGRQWTLPLLKKGYECFEPVLRLMLTVNADVRIDSTSLLYHPAMQYHHGVMDSAIRVPLVHVDDLRRLFALKQHNSSPPLESFRLDADNVTLSETTLGSGAFGDVFRGTYSMDEDYYVPLTVAIKKLKSSRCNAATQREFIYEAEVIWSLNHPFIVQCYGLCMRDSPELVMEFCSGNTLSEYITRNRLGTLERCRLLWQVSEALAYLHDRGIAHRDIKPSNILISSEGTAKVSDFGLSSVALSTEDLSEAVITNQRVYGTPNYRDPAPMTPGPEATRPSFNAASDTYSFAITAWEVLAGVTPYRDIADVTDYAIHGGRPDISQLPGDLDAEFVNVLQRCWLPVQSERPRMKDVADMLRLRVGGHAVRVPVLVRGRYPTEYAKIKHADIFYESLKTISRFTDLESVMEGSPEENRDAYRFVAEQIARDNPGA